MQGSGQGPRCARCGGLLPETAGFCPECGAPAPGQPAEDPLLGSVVADRYKLVERLGAGWAGTIYRAQHVTLKRKAAVKLLHLEHSVDALAVERFRREATAVAQLESEHLVEVFDFGTAADGRRLLITHGDSFDGVVLYARWLAFLGDKAYSLLLRANILFNAIRRRLKLPYWSLSAYMKKRVKNAVQYVCSYEEAVAHEALSRGLDGIVCGHIHCAEIREIGGITYYNDGDWVESCTALAEDAQGQIRIIDWAKETAEIVESSRPVEASA